MIWVTGTIGAMIALVLMAIGIAVIWFIVKIKGNFHIW